MPAPYRIAPTAYLLLGLALLCATVLATGTKAEPSLVHSVRTAQRAIDSFREEVVQGIEQSRLQAETSRKQRLAHRDTVLRSVPGFWATVLSKHPSSAHWFKGGVDREILEHVVLLKVSLLANSDGIRVEMELTPNKYIGDDTLHLWREFRDIDQGLEFPRDATSGIDWKEFEGRNAVKQHSFFNYFTLDHIFPMSVHDFNRALQDDIYPHPFRFYDHK